MAKSDAPVQGQMFRASPEGFVELVKACNVAYAQGLRLSGVVQLGPTQIGALFLRLQGGDVSFDE